MMDELLKLSQGPGGVGAFLAAFIIGVAVYLPKLMNGRKTDQIEGNVLDRLIAHEKRMDKMDNTIHRQAVKLTRFEVLVLRLIALLVQHQVSIPPDIQDEIDELTKTEE